MAKRRTVLVASRSLDAMVDMAAELTAQSTHKIEPRHIANGHADPLYGLESTPDLVVMLLTDSGHGDLEALASEQKPGGPPMVVVAEHGDANTMRLAMRVGARDFLSGQVSAAELSETIDRVLSQSIDTSGERDERLTIFVNAKGGSGATFLACNVAHILESVAEVPTALMGLDLQFTGLSQYFDIKLRHGLMEVLDSVYSLDDVALEAYMTKHESGLRLLAAQPENVIHISQERQGQLSALVEKMQNRYEHVVIDMPRRIDPHVVPVMQRATRIVLVLQQTLGHLHDANRMLEIFSSINIGPERVLVVVNRYNKNSAIGLEDIQRALPGTGITDVLSDFKTVAESINLGIPMHEYAKSAPVTKDLLALEAKISGREEATDTTGVFGRAFSTILRKDKWSQSQEK
ncbi:MAG: AAA family ATPase [Gammaproteobacteria bacterium]